MTLSPHEIIIPSVFVALIGAAIKFIIYKFDSNAKETKKLTFDEISKLSTKMDNMNYQITEYRKELYEKFATKAELQRSEDVNKEDHKEIKTDINDIKKDFYRYGKDKSTDS